MKDDLYKSLFDSIKNAIVIATKDKILDTNKAFLDMVKISEKTTLLDDSYYYNTIKGIITDGIKSSNFINDKEGTSILVDISLSLLVPEKEVYIVEFNRIDDSKLYNEITLFASHNRELFNNSPDSIIVLNNDSIVIDVNSAFEQVFEYPRYETIGRDIDDLIVSQPDREAAKELFQRVLNKERVGITTQRLTKSGKKVDVHIVGYPIIIDNRIGGNYVIYKDISSEVEKEKLLKEKEQFFSQLFNGSLFPIAILDKEERVLDVNQKFEQIFGFHRDEIINKSINECIIPEDYYAESNTFHEKIISRETLITKTKRKAKNGELIDVEAVGTPIIIDDQVIGLFAMYRDIRVEVQTLKELILEKLFFKQAFENSPDPIVILDMHDRVVDANQTFENKFGYSLQESRGAYINDLIVPEEYEEESIINSQKLLVEGKPIHMETMRFGKCGTGIEVDILAFPIRLDKDQLGVYVIYRDISERKNKEREITKLIYLDSLTGLYNRKHTYESLSEKIKEALANKKKLAILYFDLDGLKNVNDQKGHSAGDELLMRIAVRISDHFQGRMEISRIGGDEFLAIVTDQSKVSVSKYTKEMRQLFNKGFIVKGELTKSDISIGYANYPEDGSTVDQLITSADSRMYLEKKIKRIQKTPVRKTATLEELQKERDRD